MKIKTMKLSELNKGDRVMYPVDALIHPDYNPRHISDEARKGLQASIERFGIVQEIVVNKRNGHIIGGNQRLDAAIAQGISEVPIYVEDLDDSEEKALNVTLNNPAIQGQFEYDMLEPLLEEIKEDIGEEVYEELMLDEVELDHYESEIMNEQEGFSTYLSDQSDKIAVTFLFPKSQEEVIKENIKSNGKDYYTKIIMDDMNICLDADRK